MISVTSGNRRMSDLPDLVEKRLGPELAGNSTKADLNGFWFFRKAWQNVEPVPTHFASADAGHWRRSRRKDLIILQNRDDDPGVAY